MIRKNKMGLENGKVLFVMGLLVCWIGILPPLYAQTDCKAVLQEAFHQLEGLEKNTTQIYHTTYTCTSYYRSEPKAPLQQAKVEMDIYQGKGLVYYKGDQMVCMQDKKDLVTILPHEKKIVLKPSADSLRTSTLSMGWRGLMQDTLLANTQIQACQQVMENGKSYQKIILQVLPAYRFRWQTSQLTVWIDNQKHLCRMEIIPYGVEMVERVDMRFTPPQWLDAVPDLPDTARELAWDKKGKLLAVYQQYQVLNMNK